MTPRGSDAVERGEDADAGGVTIAFIIMTSLDDGAISAFEDSVTVWSDNAAEGS